MLSDIDNTIIAYLETSASGNSDYWSFAGNDRRKYTHNYFQYPAMMVPQMQAELIKAALNAQPSIKKVFDPFVGSGTVLIEAMVKGLDFLGRDINPLAVLLCKTKSEALNLPEISKAFETVHTNIKADSSTTVDVEFSYLKKWFRLDVAQDLSKIRRAIVKLDDLQCRRFLWVALAETVRFTSNSRTSNFKLYTRPADEITNREVSTIKIFVGIVCQNLAQLEDHLKILQEKKFIENDHYVGKVSIELGDSRSIAESNLKSDLLITSPPYGDNRTTVTYGEYSYLPLQWITLSDIDPLADSDVLSTTQTIDRRSLGGSLGNITNDVARLKERSSSLALVLEKLKNEPIDRTNRVVAFCRDLDETLDPILNQLAPNAIMIWTVGNRRVGGKEVTTDEILQQFLISRGAYLITKLQRDFPKQSKRMENVSNTMKSEKVLIMRKGDK